MIKLDFKTQNDLEREYFKKDFSCVNELMSRIRTALATNEELEINDINLDGFINFSPLNTLVFVTLFQENELSIRFGSKKVTLQETLQRVIDVLKNKKTFNNFDIQNESKCRIMLEYVINRKRIDVKDVNIGRFDFARFEPGITGLELKKGNVSYYYMPTDAIKLSQMSLGSALNSLIKNTPIKDMTNKIPERVEILSKSNEYESFIFKSRAFVTFEDTTLPLYRGNIIYDGFSYEEIYKQAINSCQWLIDNMKDNGQFLYYYDCNTDTLKDHEHPTRKPDDLYYNDLRHAGGIISLTRTYELTKDTKYLEYAKKAIDWSIGILKEHKTRFGKGLYAFYNQKAKLGGSGILLTALIRYKICSKDNSYDEQIYGLVRHLLSRICDDGEFMGYYIHPEYNNGEPLETMTEDEKKAMFSFYYPGEALFGLGLFANNFNDELCETVKNLSHKALDWLVNIRPNKYPDLFDTLPSDGWLMQAIEIWCQIEEFQKDDYINFVISDAHKMIEHQYKRDDSPYIDYEGGFYYNYGNHFYPDGARAEGLIAAYYLTKFLGKNDLAQEILDACKAAALSQFYLFNSKEYTYSHPNPSKSLNSIRFKATRQWVRVDTVEHVLCFFERLYLTSLN